MNLAVFTAAVALVIFSVFGVEAHSVRPQMQAPGWKDLSYEPPAPGSYQLPPIKKAVSGKLLRSDNSSVQLHKLMGDRIVLLSFIYTQCSDMNGCPLANAVLYKVQARLNQDAELVKSVRLLSVSFDPEHDTASVTKQYENTFQQGQVEWEFLTASNEGDLQPILDGYGQYAVREFDEYGKHTDQYSHLLRVYLIDRKMQVRNIYSVSFLHPDILMNDVKTLYMELADD